MPEIRLNRITREWVIVATERARRPEDFRREKEVRAAPASYVETCPFCPGNEAKTPPETFRIGSRDRWQVRVVPNRFAALSAEGDPLREVDGLKIRLRGVGIHEVVIETPLHDRTTALLSADEVDQILLACRHRFNSAYRDARIRHVILFKNHGEAAGTSLEHPHSQLIATPVEPGQVATREEEAIRYYEETGECLACRTLGDELSDGVRLVEQNPGFVAFVPFAALSPFHTWIFPRRHRPCFGEVDDGELAELASILRSVLARFYHGLGNPDFNYVVRSSAPGLTRPEPHHWYLSIVPRLAKAAGFELGSGMYINTALPESSADFLRSLRLP